MSVPPTRSDLEETTRRLLERYAAAWADGDVQAVTACYHDEFTVHWFGRNSLSGDHSGKAAVLEALAEFRRRTERRPPKIVAVAAGAERGAIVARERLGPDDDPVELERVLVFSFRDDLLHECWVYDADPEQIDRLVDRE